jgi:uncharacterized protein YbjT (DUF2867 family)
LVRQLGAAGYRVRVMSRRPRPAEVSAEVEWAQAQLEQGTGLAAAVAGVDVIIHAASSPFRHTQQVDVEGTHKLLAQARAAGVGHVVYISIVGIDRVPFSYYRYKLAAEQVIAASGVPWSIQRATQFHSFLHRLLQPLTRLPLALVPADLRFQPIDTAEVAARLVTTVAAGPGGRLPDIGGPAVLTAGTLAQRLLAAQGRHPRIVALRPPGRMAAAIRAGGLTCPDHAAGTVTWEEWLHKTFGWRAGGLVQGRRSPQGGSHGSL